MGKERRESLPLAKQAETLLDECRMVLPGLQALFGFQLIAVYNGSFSAKLTPREQAIHLAAIFLSALAIAVIMAPAALHRRTPHEVTSHFVELSTKLLITSMVPLALSIAIDFYLVARIVLGSTAVFWAALLLFMAFVGMWFVLPTVLRQRTAEPHHREQPG
jgi:hypothetical protein